MRITRRSAGVSGGRRTFLDALSRPVSMPEAPRRIVSLVPSITEALFAFGLAGRVVGVTRFCTQPPEMVRGLPRVGGTKNVDLDAVRRLAPDLMIANVEENTQADVEALIAAGMTVFLTYARTVEEAIDELELIGRMTDSEDTARPIVADAKSALADVLASTRDGARSRVFCPIWRNPWMSVGRDTYIHDMIAVCGGENVFAGAAGRYPATTLEEAAALAPDVVLLPDEPYRFSERHVPEVREALASSPAARGARIYLVDGKSLCWYGPRIAESLRSVSRLLQGENRV